MKSFFILFIFTTLLFAKNMSLSDALKKANENKKDVLLFIYSDYCYYCKDMIKDTFEDKEVKKYINKRFIFLKINQNKKELLREDIKTDFVPITYLISAEDKEILLELPGRKDKNIFLSILKETLLE